MESPKHSGLGIASFIISLIVGGLMVVVVIVAVVFSEQGIDENDVAMGVLGLGMFALVGADLVATALGIAALRQRDRKSLFGILGLVISIGTILVFTGIVILGLAIEGKG